MIVADVVCHCVFLSTVLCLYFGVKLLSNMISSELVHYRRLEWDVYTLFGHRLVSSINVIVFPSVGWVWSRLIIKIIQEYIGIFHWSIVLRLWLQQVGVIWCLSRFFWNYWIWIRPPNSSRYCNRAGDLYWRPNKSYME